MLPGRLATTVPQFVWANRKTYIKNVNNTNVSGAGTDTVTLDLTTGLIGHLTSSRRYKEDIKPLDKASETIYRLNPVTYRYKKEIDPTQSPAFGLVAEEVARVKLELVARNAEGQPESVHYEMINAMLLNEFLKEHQRVEEQQAAITELKSVVAHQQKEFQTAIAEQHKKFEARLNKVSVDSHWMSSSEEQEKVRDREDAGRQHASRVRSPDETDPARWEQLKVPTTIVLFVMRGCL